MNEANTKKGVRLPVTVMLLLVGTLALGAVTGAFMYATGDAVIENGFRLSMVSHTEYRFSEPGQIISRLVDFQGNPVSVTNCTATILYPDKSFFVQDALMSASTNITGDHYYGFTTPAGPEGVYEYQSTCNYGPGGTKQASVTNSFHLSSAFTDVLNNLTSMTTQLTNIEGNLSIVQIDLVNLANNVSAINASISQDILDLSNQLNSNTSTILAEFTTIQANFTHVIDDLHAINSTMLAEFTNIANNFTAIGGQLTDINNTLNTQFANLQLNVTQILDAIGNVTIDTQVLIDAHNLILGNLTDIDTDLSVILSNQAAMNITIEDTNFVVNAMNGTLSSMQTVLNTVDTTTGNTYTYLTGTLANNVNQILTDLGVINATVNRIETYSTEINATTNTILDNQEAEVHMTTFSG